MIYADASARPCVIVNPRAGRAAAMFDLAAKLASIGDVVVPASSDEARRDVREAIARGSRLLVAAGGDGTVHDVINGAAASLAEITLGVVPLGTGNDLARMLGLSLDLDEAIARVIGGATRRVDLVTVACGGREHLCLNVSAGGFAGVVDEKLGDEKPGWLGPLAYLRSALETLVDFPAYRLEILADGERALMDGCNVVVANGRTLGGGIPIAPRAELDDGLLEVIVLKSTRAAALVRLVPLILAGTHLEDDEVFYRRARAVEVRAIPPAPFNADGELIGETPVVYRVLPAALRVTGFARRASSLT